MLSNKVLRQIFPQSVFMDHTFKNNVSFKVMMIYYACIYYYDEIKVCNPLGPNTTTY